MGANPHRTRMLGKKCVGLENMAVRNIKRKYGMFRVSQILLADKAKSAYWKQHISVVSYGQVPGCLLFGASSLIGP